MVTRFNLASGGSLSLALLSASPARKEAAAPRAGADGEARLRAALLEALLASGYLGREDDAVLA
ncbi:MAG TPA: hypothetical protein PLI95_09650, partial [Polyangiaceae bacterium]|nr:hypothetical protein [Polyangiaceae bacterium]